MEFWGVEVKPGQNLIVKPDRGRAIHMSQAALGEGKKEKGNDFVTLRVKINGEKFVVGSLSWEKFPQITFELIFEKEFELSHDWKIGKSESSDEEDTLVGITENGKIEPKVEEVKPTASKGKSAKPEGSAKPKVTVVEPKKDDKSDKGDESDEVEDESNDDEDILDALDDSDSQDEDDSEDEDEEAPKKTEPSKKRPTESATKTPVPAKKAKVATPQKTDGKKRGGHTATPHPSKKADTATPHPSMKIGKTPDNSKKTKEQTPNSDAQVACKSCSRTFKSESALESHTKAKHTAGK
ncbi:hypothetical protein U1Q18_025173 [Sarracenia purpurea var. burkii]